MKVIVLGAGIVGVTSAWFLAREGHEVTVVDRQPGPARETSFANGGQVSITHSTPWANPSAPADILRWLGHEDAPLLFRPRAELAQWLWGARFLFGTHIDALEREGGRIPAVRVRRERASERLAADAFLVCMGSYSPLLLAPVGIRVPIYPLKGYSITLPVDDAAAAPTVSITDEAMKIVISRLGNRLRAAGTAEVNGYDTELNAARCGAIVDRVFELFPRAGRRDAVTLWTGLRPSTPSNVPLVGRTRYPNLFLNTGHGTLGWTMACGCARAVADLMSGRTPELGL